MNWQQAVENTVTGLGYELVDCELASRGLLCVTIDRIPGRMYDPAPAIGAEDGVAGRSQVSAADVVAMSVTVEDCERVTRQLQYLLEVEGVDYARLEVGSPGVDRPLKTEAQLVRFSGFEIDLTLKLVFQGRKRYRGVLHAAEGAERFELVFHDGKEEQVLGFTLAEVREARLVPVLDFKGRQRTQRPGADAAAPKRKRARSNAKAKAVGPESGGHEE
jgi:ribosome maturation factor RimP